MSFEIYLEDSVPNFNFVSTSYFNTENASAECALLLLKLHQIQIYQILYSF